MSETNTHKATKRAKGRRKAGTPRDTGRIQVRRETAEYRAAAQEQASRVREEIDAALADARRTREEIEARIEQQWHNRPASVAPTTAGLGGRRRRAKA
ncbi:hypothetical protein [Hyalangium rubrum]|uniref:Uncharacterized protein n=1 Tax=Hyalangium rubrum TaxID=3103134 RepID=A0ABU5GZA3_9BACT|nr:hypothetical protein [Hyalangium sp. s54d21]MDY7226391.1 hypothetical protein [Hyalangium sp. s54d21]